MKKNLLACSALLLLASCGYSSSDVEAVGQAKKLSHKNNIVCPNFWEVDLSLGVMRNGTGSMSTQDIWVQVDNAQDLAAIRKAMDAGSVVKITYNVPRMPICTDDYVMSHVEISQ